MGFYYKAYQHARFYVIVLGILLSGSVSADINPSNKAEIITVSLQVVDENGNPIANAEVSVGEISITVDEKGQVSFKVNSDDPVTFSAPGFDKKIIVGEDISRSTSISLEKSKLPMDPKAIIPLPYLDVDRRHATGSYNVIKGEQLMGYPSTDLRLSFAGKATGLQVTEHHGAPGTHPTEQRGFYGFSNKASITARGRNLAYVIDGMPADIAEIPLDPGEVASVTVIKDIVGKSMYGPLGADGIMFIETRRGSENESFLRVNVESGTSIIDRFPEWVSGADYARLNNLAREADGLSPSYSPSDIAEYEKNNPYSLKYPSVDYRDYMLKDNRAFRRANLSAGGGSESARYFLYLGYNHEGDIFGIGSKADYNRLNIRSNVDIEINDRLSTELDINGSLGLRRTPGYGYTTAEGQQYMGIYELDVAIPQIIATPPIEFPVYANNDPELSLPWYGISSRYPNPIGNLLGSGDYSEQNRQAGVKLAVNYDLSQLVSGLQSRTSFGFDALNLIRIGQANQYEGYNVSVGVSDTTFTRLQTGISNDTQLKLHDYYFIRTAFSQSLKYNWNIENHDLESSLTYFLYRKFSDNARNPEPQMLGVWTGKYTFHDKYTLMGVLNYAHTLSFIEEKRGEVFPSLGLSWLLSEEPFLKDLDFVDFLKLRGEVGVIGYDPYLDPHIVRSRFIATTRSSFGPHPLNRWFGTDVETNPPSTYPTWVGNADLGWEKRREFNIGIDGLLFDQKLSVEVNYFNTLRDGIITRLTNSMPAVTGMSGALPYFNHDQYQYYGMETGLQWTDQIGKLGFSIGGNATFQNSKIKKFDEPNYRYDYQFRLDKPIDTYWGLNYLGRFSSDAESLEIPQLFDPYLQEGDLKYEDMNGDGVVDENDFAAIGNTAPRLFYSLSLNFKYNNFELSIIGTGASLFDIPLTSPYFHNGWGDNNYSAFVRDNIGGDYPRLTFERVNNNFMASSFWLTRGDYFKVKNAEFAYTIPEGKLKVITSKGIRLFVRGSNILTLSQVKEIDPESPYSGITRYPLYKTFTAGASLNF